MGCIITRGLAQARPGLLRTPLLPSRTHTEGHSRHTENHADVQPTDVKFFIMEIISMPTLLEDQGSHAAEPLPRTRHG